MSKTHDDVEFAVDDASGRQRTFDTFDEAAGFAVVIAASTGKTVNLDTLVWSEEGAAFFAGDDGVEEYLEDPEASVFNRVEISVNNAGRIA